jgi:hypothetical protein
MDEHLTPLPDDAPCSSTQATVADSTKRPTQRRKKPSSAVSNQVNSRRYLELVKNTGNDVGGFLKYIFQHKLEPLDTLLSTVESVFEEMDVNMQNHVQRILGNSLKEGEQVPLERGMALKCDLQLTRRDYQTLRKVFPTLPTFNEVAKALDDITPELVTLYDADGKF